MNLASITSTRLLPLLLLVLLSVGCDQQPAAPARLGYVQFKTSAHCDNCKRTIEGALQKVPGLKSATLDVPSKVATVTYDPARAEAAQFQKAIEDVGYVATQMP